MSTSPISAVIVPPCSQSSSTCRRVCRATTRFRRLFRLLDPASFARCFGAFLDQLGEAGAGVLAIDGKTLRRSFDTAAGQSPLHVVTAFGCERRLVLAQAAVRSKENEILAARDVLNMLDIKGMLVTADALHCNAGTTALIVERGADYLIGLKANRPAMLRDVKQLFAQPPCAPSEHVTVDANHGRVETRRHQVWHGVDWLTPTRSESEGAPLAGLAMVGKIETTVERAGTPTPRPALLRLVTPVVGGSVRRGRPRPLADRKRPALGARHLFRRGSRAQPTRPRPRKPHHAAQARPQRAAIRTTRHLHPT